MEVIDAYGLAAGLQVADALIAATALDHDFTLLAVNTKHFSPIEALRSERFEPGI